MGGCQAGQTISMRTVTGLWGEKVQYIVTNMSSVGYPLEGDFEGAVEHAADLLLEECSAMRDIEDFFGDGGRLTVTGKTVSYAGRQYTVTNMSSVAAKVDATGTVIDPT